MAKKRKVSSDISSKTKIISDSADKAVSRNLVFDFSSISAWRSCKMGNFNSYLSNEKDFIEKFRTAMKLVQTLSEHKPDRIFNCGNFSHCHAIDDEKTKIIVSLLTQKLGISEQVVVGEKLMQVGLDKGFRMIGVCNDNIFRVYLIDYHHSLYYDERKDRNKKSNKRFCPIKGWK